MALRRLPVDADGFFKVDGRFEPRAMRLYKAHEWLPIVGFKEPQRAANRRVGGAGWRYEVQVMMGVIRKACGGGFSSVGCPCRC